MLKKLVFCLYLVLGLSISAQESAISSALTLKVTPGLEIPLGASAERHTLGGSGTFTANFGLPLKLPLYVSGDLSYGLLPFDLVNVKRLSLLSVGTGIGVDRQIRGRLFGNAYIKGGYYLGFTEDDNGEVLTGGNPYLWGGAELNYYLSQSITLVFGGLYKNYLGSPESLVSTAGVYLGTSHRSYIGREASPFSLSPPKPGRLQVSEISFDEVFPVFYQYYDNKPIGKARIKNLERAKVRDLKVSVYIKQYMDSPKVYEFPDELAKNEEIEIPLYALFNDRVLEITEGTKVAAEITLDYMLRAEPRSQVERATLSLNHRNAAIWDDDRRAAAFVTANDPAVLRLGKSTAGLVREHGYPALDLNLRIGIALNQALAEYGMNYVVDRSTPYSEFVEKKYAIDFLQFPRQTLEYRAGDCDDLAILYAALLEAVSVETAFITIPGHIYIAFSLQMTPQEARRFFSNPDSVIETGDKTWLPLEVTKIQDGFLKAWDSGAQDWRKYKSSGEAGFYPIHEAWNVFAPVGLPGEGAALDLPSERTTATAYERELNRLIERELFPRVEQLKAEISRSGGDVRLINRLGVLYARYGRQADAQKEFQKILSRGDYFPALVNMGNIHYLNKELEQAKDYYQRAYRKDPENPTILVSLAKVAHDLEEYGEAEEAYNKLRVVSPKLAQQFDYLAVQGTGTARAGDTDSKRGVVLWEEEE
jgi:tetratricopeptide (TPR) repeat protein